MRVAHVLRAVAVAGAFCASCANPNEPKDRLVELFVTASASPCAITIGGGYGYGYACMDVRELPYGDWETVGFGSIEGFTFQIGFKYRLLVVVRRDPDPPVAGPSRTYHFRRLIERSADTPP
jgi:Domain of unknown function (DUF4377)